MSVLGGAGRNRSPDASDSPRDELGSEWLGDWRAELRYSDEKKEYLNGSRVS